MNKITAIRTLITNLQREASPHERLWLAVVEKFLVDSLRGRDTMVQDKSEGFLFACDMAGVNPDYVREMVCR